MGIRFIKKTAFCFFYMFSRKILEVHIDFFFLIYSFVPLTTRWFLKKEI